MGAWLIMALNGTLLGVCCYLVASVVTEISSEALEPMPLGTTSTELEVPSESQRASPSLILDRNLFGAQLVGDNPPPDAEIDLPLTATKLPLKLLGTAAASVDERSRAAIEDTKRKKHMVVAIGDGIVGHPRVRVKGIERSRVILDNAGQPEELVLKEKVHGGRVSKSSSQKARRANRKRAPRQSARLNDRLQELASNDGTSITELMSSARILPEYVEGEIRGMKVDSIKPDSVFTRMGLQDGDVITEVNGIVIDHADVTNSIFAEFAKADVIKTAILRDGNTLTLSAAAAELME